MKSTGIVRRLDELGRIVLPIELRRVLDIGDRDALEIYTDEDRVVLKKYQPDCVFCGEGGEMTHFKGKHICSTCLAELK